MKAILYILPALVFLAASCQSDNSRAQLQAQCAQAGQAMQDRDKNGDFGPYQVNYHYNAKRQQCLYHAIVPFGVGFSDKVVRDAYENKTLIKCSVSSDGKDQGCVSNLAEKNKTLSRDEAEKLMNELMEQ